MGYMGWQACLPLYSIFCSLSHTTLLGDFGKDLSRKKGVGIGVAGSGDGDGAGALNGVNEFVSFFFSPTLLFEYMI